MTAINTLKDKLLSDDNELTLVKFFIDEFINDEDFRSESEPHLHPLLEYAMMEMFLSHYSEDADDVAGQILRFRESDLFLRHYRQ